MLQHYGNTDVAILPHNVVQHILLGVSIPYYLYCLFLKFLTFLVAEYSQWAFIFSPQELWSLHSTWRHRWSDLNRTPSDLLSSPCLGGTSQLIWTSMQVFQVWGAKEEGKRLRSWRGNFLTMMRLPSSNQNKISWNRLSNWSIFPAGFPHSCRDFQRCSCPSQKWRV